MNGRLYDPLLRRFLNADEHIQDPYNTQNYNKYGYVYNNPLMYNDPSGEFVFTALAVWLGSKVLATAVVGAVMGVLSYTVGLAVTGNLHQWSLGGALKSAFWGGIGGAVSFGVGSIFSNTAGTLTTFASNLKETIGRVGLAIVQAGTHAVSQGVLSVMQGGDFVSSVAGSFFGSLGASAFEAIAGDFASSAGGTIAFGALSGGIGAELTGGNFWEGAVIGGVVAGLNHVAHRQNPPPPEKSLLDTAGEWVTDYFDYNGDGQVAGWDYALGAVDVGITIFDIVTVPSGEGVAAHLALKGSARAIGKSQIKTTITKKASSSVGKIVSNTTAKKGNAIQLTFKENISASQMYKLMNPKAINLNKSGGFISPNGIKWQYYKGGTTNPAGWTIKGVTPNKQTIIMRFSK